jgi:galactokinase
MDRKSKLLFLESLADFQKEIEEAEYESGASVGLGVRTETRAFGDFGDAELKKLSPDLSEKDRIAIWKKLHQAGGGTPDYLSLEAILQSVTPKDEQELKAKIRRKVVVVLSDGDSENAERVQEALKALRAKGVIVLGLGMTESGQAVKETYKPDAEVIEDITTLPRAVQKVILQYTKDL